MTDHERDKIIRMAWEDRTTFDEIKKKSGLNEAQVIKLMRKEMKPSSFRMWRKRVAGRITKHRQRFLLNVIVQKGAARSQRTIYLRYITSLIAAIARYRAELEVTDETRETIQWIKNPPLPATSRPMYALLFQSALASLGSEYHHVY